MLLLLSVQLFAQNDFVISGKFKIDGGTNNGAKIVVEKNGKRVKQLEGESRFEIGLDFQAIYVVSFEKEGFVTKRLRFDTHVPEDRIEYGFEPFPFTVEIFEQYDDVNMVVFNQPVGRISYSELIDEFDYDTDYTKSIQAQIDQAMDEVEEAKEKKADQVVQKEKELAQLSKTAESSAKSGNFTDAIKQYEEALKLKKDPVIEKRIEELKKEAEGQKKQQEFEGVLEKAEQAMAAGDLDEAKRLFDQANGVLQGDARVTKALAQIEQEKKAQAAQGKAFDDAVKAAEAALNAGNPAQAIAKAEEALKIKADPKAEQILAKATEAKGAAEAKAKAAAELEEQVAGLLADAQKAKDKGDLEQALALLEQAKQLKADPSIDQEIKSVKTAVAQLEEEKKKEEAAKAQLAGLLDEAEKLLADGDIAGAKAKLTAAGELGEDKRISSIASAIEAEEKRKAEADAAAKEAEAAAAAAAAEAAEKAKMDEQINAAKQALESDNLEGARTALKAAGELGSDPRIGDIEKQIAAREKAIADAKSAEEAAQKAKEEAKAKYAELIVAGNEALNAKELTKAEKAFNDAKAIADDPSDANKGLAAVEEMRSKLSALQREEEAAAAKAAAAAEKQKQIAAAIDKADKAFEKDKWDEAKGLYNEVLSIGPNEKASQQIAAIDLKLEELEAARQAELASMEASERKAAEEEAEREAAEEEAARKAAEEEAARKAAEEEAARLAAEEAAQKAAEEEAAKASSAEAAAKQAAEEEARKLAEAEAARKAAEAEAARKAEEEAARLAAESAAAKSEELPVDNSKAEEQAAAEAAARKAAEEAAKLKAAIADKRVEADGLFQSNRLDQAVKAYNELLSMAPGDEDAKKRIDQISDIKRKLAAEKAANEKAALAITDQKGRESEQLADIINEEEIKAVVNPVREEPDIASDKSPEAETPSPSVGESGSFNVAQAVMEQDVRPGAPTGPIIISDEKVGDEALQTRTGQMTEDDKYDGMIKRTEEQIVEFVASEEMKALMAQYPDRRTVATEVVGNSEITWVYINNGEFIVTFKKVKHNWGGVYYFVDGQATNQRFWEHESQ
ncbi:MAG: hypothetical protein RLP15_05230 [Cryomorphaceae bacterium]